MPRQRRERRPFVERLIFGIPVIGWMLRGLSEGDDATMLWFVVAVVSLLGLATVLFGVPGLVVGMLAVAFVTLATILLITFGR